MKLTINLIALLFGLIIFVDFFFFDRPTNIFYIPIIFVVCVILGILNRKSNKSYAYWRGLLIGIRIFFFGIICSILFLAIVSFFKLFKPLASIYGRNIAESTGDRLVLVFSQIGMILPPLTVILTFSLIPMLIIPLFFLRKSKQTDDIIDADLIDNEQK